MRASKRRRNNPSLPAGPSTPRTQHQVTVVRQEEMWSGPLPSPQTLSEFQALVPDAPERIFRQWEEETKHRRDYENRALDAFHERTTRGQWAAIVFALAALAVSAFAIGMGHSWVGGVLGGGTIATVVGAFLADRKRVQQKAP
jgi:Predicted membrane protein